MGILRPVLVWSFVGYVALMGPSLVAQVVEKAIEGQLEVHSDASEWGNSFLWAVAMSWLLRILKKYPRFSWLSNESTLWAQRSWAVAVAFLSGLGVSFVYDPATGTYGVTGLTTAALYHFVRQFFMQEVVYQSAIKKIPHV